MSAVADQIAKNWSGETEHVDGTQSADEEKTPTQTDTLKETIAAGVKEAEQFLAESMAYIEDERELKDAANDKAKQHTANVTAKLKEITAKGWNKDAVKDAIAFKNKAAKDQENYDITYKHMRNVLGHPIQTDLFMD